MTCNIRTSVILGLITLLAVVAVGQGAAPLSDTVGRTEITKWQYGKSGAVSLTYDDGSLNQFRVAVPIMDTFGFPATFFIITGEMPGSRYHGTFIGRPVKEIIAEAAAVPTSKDNFFERASAVGYLGYEGTLEYHTRAGEVYDEGNATAASAQKAYQIIDEAYARVRQGAFKPNAEGEPLAGKREHVTWEELSALAQRGYEMASHTVTHPRLAAFWCR